MFELDAQFSNNALQWTLTLMIGAYICRYW